MSYSIAFCRCTFEDTCGWTREAAVQRFGHTSVSQVFRHYRRPFGQGVVKRVGWRLPGGPLACCHVLRRLSFHNQWSLSPPSFPPPLTPPSLPLVRHCRTPFGQGVVTRVGWRLPGGPLACCHVLRRLSFHNRWSLSPPCATFSASFGRSGIYLDR